VRYRRAAFCCAFLCVKGLNAKDIHKEIIPVYGGECLSRKAFHNWVEKYLDGKSFADEKEVEAEVRKWLRQESKTSVLRVSMHW
jgi:hypothetical protein